MGGPVLSQLEIDALLNNNDSEEYKVSQEEHSVRAFDFLHDRIVRNKMSALNRINEKFSRSMRSNLFNFIRKSCNVTYTGIITKKYGEYMSNMQLPSSINIVKMHPLRGQTLFMLDAKLAYILVDNFFGGEGKFYKQNTVRDFTQTETKLILRILDIAFKDMTDAWKLFLDIKYEYINSEFNPSMVSVVSPGEVMVISNFCIELEGGSGELHVAIPYTTLEPIRSILDSGAQSDSVESDTTWQKLFSEEIYGSKVSLKAVVAKKTMHLKEIIGLDKGDIIPIDIPKNSVVLAESIPVFYAKLGKHNNNYALKINHIVGSNI